MKRSVIDTLTSNLSGLFQLKGPRAEAGRDGYGPLTTSLADSLGQDPQAVNDALNRLEGSDHPHVRMKGFDIARLLVMQELGILSHYETRPSELSGVEARAPRR